MKTKRCCFFKFAFGDAVRLRNAVRGHGGSFQAVSLKMAITEIPLSKIMSPSKPVHVINVGEDFEREVSHERPVVVDLGAVVRPMLGRVGADLRRP